MATNDGYSPYPIGLTAVDTVAALTRAHNSNTLFVNYVAQAAVPTSISHNGDIWNDIDTNKLYRAYKQDNVVQWLEV